MTAYSDNLRIPHLGQNIAQPEIPENTAKDIIDSFLSNTYTIDAVDNLDIVISHTDSITGATDWQSFFIEITDDSDNMLSARTVTLPDNARPYIFKNNTNSGTGGVVLTFKTTSGTGFTVAAGSNAYGYSDGTNLELLEFIASGAGTTLESNTDTETGYGTDGQALITNGVDFFTYQDIISAIGESTDIPAGYGTNGQVLVTNGTDAFTYTDLISSIGASSDITAGYGTVGQVIVTNGADAFTYEDFVTGVTLEGPNAITDEDGVDYGFLYTGTADISFATDATIGTGMMYGTQGFVAINTDIEFFNIDPSISETLMLGANTKVTHADASVTTLNNPEWIAQNAQRTADIALKNTMDINFAIETLAKASKLTLTAVGAETGAGEYTFVIAP